MFAYSPTVNDNSGQILGEAQRLAKELRAKEQQQMWQGIASGVSNIAQGALESYQKSQENKMTSDYLDAMAGQFSNTMGADGVTPMMSAEDLEKFTKASLPKKQGMIVPLQAQFEQNLKNQYLAAQIAGFGQRHAYQNQVPANQQPVSAGGGGAAPNNPGAQPFIIGSDIQTRPAYQPR